MELNIQLFASASVQSTKHDGRYLKLTVTEESTSIEDNTSTIYWKFESIGGNSTYYTIYDYGVYYNGNQLYDTSAGGSLKTKNYTNHSFPVTKGTKDGRFTITHNADGTASPITFSMFGSVSANATKQYDVSLPLTTIPRASQPRLSVSPGTMGTPITIYTDRVSQNFTHTLTYYFGNDSGTIATNVGDSVVWDTTNGNTIDLAHQIPSNTLGQGAIYCETFSNGVSIGTKFCTLLLQIPSTMKPTASITSYAEQDPTMLSLNWGCYVQNKSQIRIQTSGQGTYSSSISAYSMNLNGNSYGTNDYTTGIINSTNLSITAYAQDTRGVWSDGVSTNVPLVAYSNPQITTATADRCNSNGDLDDNGTYLKYTYVGSISPVNNGTQNKNAHSFRIWYKEKTDATYPANNYFDIDNTNYTIASGSQAGVLNANLDTSKSYDIKFEASDSFTTTEVIRQIDTGFDLMNFNASGKAMAIGKVSEAGANEELFEIGIDTEIEGDLSVSGIIDGTIDGTDVWNTFKTLSGNARLNLQQILTPKANDGLAKYNRLGGIDFNDLVEYGSGLYSVVGTAHSPGGANDQWWQVIQIVMPDANYVQQYASQMFDGRNIWVRYGVNGSYGEWLLISNAYYNIAYYAGVWTNGNYIKRQVIEGTLDANGQAFVNFGKKIIKAEGFALSNYGQWWPLGQYFWSEPGYSTALYLPGGTQLQITTAGYFTNNNQYFVIVEYVD